jgi:hypothetical protein
VAALACEEIRKSDHKNAISSDFGGWLGYGVLDAKEVRHVYQPNRPGNNSFVLAVGV